MRYRFEFFALAALLASSLVASPVAAQVLLKGGTVHTVSGEAIEGGDVLLGADGTIVAVGVDLEAPEGAEVVDVGGKVVTPGLIEAHSVVGLVEVWAVGGTRDADAGDREGDLVRAAFRAADGFNPASVALPITRSGGVTAVVIGPGGGLVQGQAAWVELRGEGPRHATVVEPSLAFHVAMGERASHEAGGSRGAALLALRELYDDVVFYRDHQERFDQNRARELSASRLDLLALQRTLDRKTPVVFEVHRASDIVAALDFAKAQGLRPILAGAAEAWMVRERLAAEAVPVIVDPLSNLPWSFESLGARADNATLLAAAGVPVIVSTFSSHNVRKLRQVAGNAVRAGLPWEAALRAVTLAPAQAFGQAERYGALAPGRVADVVVWSGDPFEASSRVEHLFIGGEAVDPDHNRQQALFERYRELPRRAAPASLPRPEPAPETDDEP